MAVLDLQHLPGRLMMKPGVEVLFRGIYFVNVHMPTGKTLPFFADSPGARLVWQDSSSYREVGLSVAASAAYVLSLSRPSSDPGPQRVEVLPPGAACLTTADSAAATVGISSAAMGGSAATASAAGGNGTSGGGGGEAGGLRPVVACVPYPVSVSYDVAVDVGVDSSQSSTGMSYGGYVHVARNHTYWTQHDLSPECLRLKPQAVCVADKVAELEAAAARAAQEDQEERSKQTMLVVAVVVPVSVAALAAAIGAWAALRHSRASRAAAAAAAAAAATAGAAAVGHQSSADSLHRLQQPPPPQHPKLADSQVAQYEWPGGAWWSHAAEGAGGAGGGSKLGCDVGDGATGGADRGRRDSDCAGDSEHTGDGGVCVFGRGSRRSSFSSGPPPAAAVVAALGRGDGAATSAAPLHAYGAAAYAVAGAAGAAGAACGGMGGGMGGPAPALAPAPATMAEMAALTTPLSSAVFTGGSGALAAAERRLFGGLDECEQPLWERLPPPGSSMVAQGLQGAADGTPAATLDGAVCDGAPQGDDDDALQAMAADLGLRLNGAGHGHSATVGRSVGRVGEGCSGTGTGTVSNGGEEEEEEEEEEEQLVGETVITLRLEAGKVRKALAALAAAGAIALHGSAASAVAATLDSAASTPPQSGGGGGTAGGSGSVRDSGSGSGGIDRSSGVQSQEHSRGVKAAPCVGARTGRGSAGASHGEGRSASAGACGGDAGGGGGGGALSAWPQPVALTPQQQHAETPLGAGAAAAPAIPPAAAAAGAAAYRSGQAAAAAAAASQPCPPAASLLKPPGNLACLASRPVPIVSLQLAPTEDAPSPRVAPALPLQLQPQQPQQPEQLQQQPIAVGDSPGNKTGAGQQPADGALSVPELQRSGGAAAAAAAVAAATAAPAAAPAGGATAGARGNEGAGGERVSSELHHDPVELELEQLKRRHAAVRDVSLRIRAVLGTGGFGTVYLGEWQGLECAIKVLVFGGSREARKAALREAALCTSINHPNVAATYLVDLQPLVAVHDTPAAPPPPPTSGRDGATGAPDVHAGTALAGPAALQPPHAQQGHHQQHPHPLPHPHPLKTYRMYIIQEFCDAGTLRGLIASGWLLECGPGGPPVPAVPGPEPIFPRLHPDPEQEAVAAAVASGQLVLRVRLPALYELALGIARALAHLHSKSIVHSDLTPNNILLKRDPAARCGLSAKVADFGLSVIVPDSRTHLSNRLCGSPFYIAPEVCALGRQSTQSDMFSFGVVLWEMFMGTAAGQRDLATGRLCYHPAFPNLPADCPVQYHRIVQWCLQKDPARRPAAAMVAAVLRDQLVAVLGLALQGWGSGGAAAGGGGGTAGGGDLGAAVAHA
ncbi:hypothetical protein HYH02_001728 [Chlamydomonas schloesseri]|uniref:Protein kinase domain-containing protein n=1 Tax=Chlamydomonas schloesseri TaxID=2026947 RepID=A0A835WSR0_9CHLO|nr:hypothetical protein HYH02_001728 [Chlamydomonas schloesseri]|eukprot:KAG2453508.1 hypothetical protein HYH02_001728 [Chlamydomonas schloesseri]